jgi:transposase-like protein
MSNSEREKKIQTIRNMEEQSKFYQIRLDNLPQSKTRDAIKEQYLKHLGKYTTKIDSIRKEFNDGNK